MNKLHNWINTGLIVLVGILVLVGGSSQSVGGTRFQSGISADDTSPSSGEVRGTTLTITSTAAITGAATFSGAISASSGAATFATTTTGNLVHGTGIFSTSTTGTFTEDQLLANSGIYITATGAGQATLSLTLPATSTMTTLIDTAGSCRSWFIDASDVAAATTTTIVAGTGWDLVGLDATGAGTGADVIDGAEFGTFTACRATDDDVVGYIEEWIAAD